MNSLDTAKAAPLEEKLRSYVAALATIHSASAEVVKGCRALVVEQLPTLSQLLGVTAATKDIKDEVLPAKIQEFSEGWAWIGVFIALVPAKLWFSVGLYIDETGDTNQRVGAYAGIYVATLAKAKSLFNSLSEVSRQALQLDDEGYGICALEPVPDDALGSYQNALRKVVQRWVGPEGAKTLSALAKKMDFLPR